MQKMNIVNYLEMVSNGNLVINVLNHIVIVVTLVLYFKNFRNKEKIAVGAIGILFLSVMGNAIYYGNPFHLVTFSIMESLVIWAFIKCKVESTKREKNHIVVSISAVFIFLGIWYPEFVHTNIVASLVVSPLGLVPCPTLLTCMGILNIIHTEVDRKLFICGLGFTIIYGVIGTFNFHVYYDIILLALAIFSISNLKRNA